MMRTEESVHRKASGSWKVLQPDLGVVAWTWKGHG